MTFGGFPEVVKFTPPSFLPVPVSQESTFLPSLQSHGGPSALGAQFLPGQPRPSFFLGPPHPGCLDVSLPPFGVLPHPSQTCLVERISP